MVRDGQKVWPFCTSCGCRLDIFLLGGFAHLSHFKVFESDAKGHECEKVSHAWQIPASDIAYLLGVSNE